MDMVMLSRIQFALIVTFHFVFVPMSVGLGLIQGIFQTKYYRSRDPKDAAAVRLWTKIFAVTFTVGVATGITEEFSFGTNWADYSRFVGDIFGAPLAAEALFAFFMESVFLGVLLFGGKRIGPKFRLVSSWLVFAGSLLSALWIIIANSWMQTPAGAVLSADGSKAIITDFFAAAFNPSTGARYFHTATAVLVMGGFFAMAVAGYYLLKKRHTDFAKKTARIGCIVAVISACALLVSAHTTAVGVSENQPTKLAAMEGMYEDEAAPLYLFGFVDEENQQVIAPISIPGGTSFLATNDFNTVLPGLNSLSQTDQFGDLNPEEMPVNLVFSTYHTMVAMFGLICLILLLVIIGLVRKKIPDWKWLQRIMIISPLFPFLAIEAGWWTAEVGRQPWVVYPVVGGPDGVSLLTENGISLSVTPTEMVITIVIFVVIYALLFVAWARLVAKFIKEGPEESADDGLASASDAALGEGSAKAAVSAAPAAALQKDGE